MSLADHNRSQSLFQPDPSKPPFDSGSSEAQIWQQFKAGNETAFIHIYEQHYSSLLHYGLNFIANRETVKDCIQDLFIEIREKRATIGSTDTIKPFLFTILRRKIARHVRNHPDKLQLTPAAEKFRIEVSYEQQLIDRQFNEMQITKLREAVTKLSVKEREAIFLYFFENQSYQEITTILGYREVKTTRNLIYKAIASLREKLDPGIILHCFPFI
jgi:RNA polymerase sigma factor (sigma-70 family)